MNIILFGYSEGIGLTYHLTYFAISLNKLKSDLTVIHNGKEQNPGLLDKLKSSNVKSTDVKDIKSIFSTVEEDTVFHCQGFNQVKLIEKHSKEKNSKIVITLNAYRNGKWYKNLYIKYVSWRFKNIDKWIFSTYYSFLDFNRNNFKSDFAIVPLGLEDTQDLVAVNEYTDIFSNQTENYLSSNKYIFYAAQFHKHKKHIELLHTISPVLKSDKKLQLMLCGSGTLIGKVQKLSSKLGIRTQVKFLGRIDRNIFLQHMKNANIAVVASKTETFGHNILEPLLLNIPVISTPVGIAPEVIKDYMNGALSDLNNKNKFNNSIRYFCTRHHISNINNSLKDEFSWDNIAIRYYNAYNSLYENYN